MTNTRAQAAKEKGNAAFKGGDYPSAIGHYSEAILADRTDPTLPLNRAAAYLKLGKNEDAERDSTTVLQSSPSNVKALFRRAQAREALGNLLDARQDLNDALAVEPRNTSIKDEAKKVEQLIAVEKSKKAKVESARASVPTPSPITSKSTSSPPPKRRRVPIEIIEPPGYRRPSQPPQAISAAKATDVKPQQTVIPPMQPAVSVPVPMLPPTTKPKVETDAMTPVSTRSLKSPSASSTQLSQSQSKPPTTASIPTASATTASITTLPSKPSPSNFAEAKATRDGSKPSHVGPSAGVGGGIFRANGQNTTFSSRTQTSASVSVSVPTSSDTIRGEAQPPTDGTQATTRFPLNIAIASGSGSPMTMFNFNKAWEASPSAEDRWKLITSIPPTNIPALCKSSLEPSLFISIIDLLREVVESNSEQDKDSGEVVKAYLKAFEGVPRFNTVLLFLSKKEKRRVRELWQLLGVENLSGIWNVLVR